MKLFEILEAEDLDESGSRYEMCLVWKSEEEAAKVKEMANKRDGVDLEVDWNVMYFPDKFTYDHIIYHYFVKMAPDHRPEKKAVKDLRDGDLHKTA